jgi:transposase
MDYFSGLDVSMDETHVCILDREGLVVRESKTESTAQAIPGELSKAPSCRRHVEKGVVFSPKALSSMGER